uniref:Uncharacterized protein n=1 Tax=Arundo donax TaxID=35708 RepID=A0A0A8Y1K9_ARUDO
MVQTVSSFKRRTSAHAQFIKGQQKKYSAVTG